MTFSPWQPGQNQLDKLILTTPKGARAEVYRYGAHLSHWQTAEGEKGLFLSERAEFEEGRAIRGGVPIIFPQFNAFGAGPRHGFARLSNWELLERKSGECTFELRDNDKTRDAWPHAFEVQFLVALTDNSLNMQLRVSNPGATPFNFTAALHSYLAVEDAYQLALSNLAGVNYWDNDGSPFEQRKHQKETLLTPTPPIDRVYFRCPPSLSLQDRGRLFTIDHQGFEDCVVWNPGPAEATQLSDLGDDEYRCMLCVEAAQIDHPVALAPNQTWVGSQKLTLTRA